MCDFAQVFDVSPIRVGLVAPTTSISAKTTDNFEQMITCACVRFFAHIITCACVHARACLANWLHCAMHTHAQVVLCAKERVWRKGCTFTDQHSVTCSPNTLWQGIINFGLQTTEGIKAHLEEQPVPTQIFKRQCSSTQSHDRGEIGCLRVRSFNLSSSIPGYAPTMTLPGTTQLE